MLALNGRWLLTVTLLLVVLPMATDAGITDVKVTTDRSIDCSSFQSIARDLFRDCKTDEAKAIGRGTSCGGRISTGRKSRTCRRSTC